MATGIETTRLRKLWLTTMIRTGLRLPVLNGLFLDSFDIGAEYLLPVLQCLTNSRTNNSNPNEAGRVTPIKCFGDHFQTFCCHGKTFRRDALSCWTPSKPLEMTAKGFETMPKGFENGSSPCVHEEKSELGSIAPQGDPTEPGPVSVEPKRDCVGRWSKPIKMTAGGLYLGN
jgi:hypothetical protein